MFTSLIFINPLYSKMDHFRKYKSNKWDRKQQGIRPHLEDKALANPPCGVIAGVVILTQISGSHKRNSHRIPENHLDGRGRHRRQVKRAQFSLQRQMHVHIAHARQRIPFHGGDRDQIGPFGLRAGHKPNKFLGGTRFAEEDENVPLGENSDIAMESVHRGQECGSDAQGDKSLGDLVGDEAGFADAREEDGAGGIEEGTSEG